MTTTKIRKEINNKKKMRPNRELSGYDLLFRIQWGDRKPLWFCRILSICGYKIHKYTYRAEKFFSLSLSFLSSKNFPSIYPQTIIVIFQTLTIFFLDDDGVLMYTLGIYELFHLHRKERKNFFLSLSSLRINTCFLMVVIDR